MAIEMLRPPNLMLTQVTVSESSDSPAWMPWVQSQPGSSSTSSSSCGICAASGLCSIPTFTVFCPGFQKGRVPSEKGTLAR